MSESRETRPIVSAIFAAQYRTPEMGAIFSEAAQLQFMLDTEAALARAEAALGLVPDPIAEAITAAARLDKLNFERITASTRKVGYPVAGLVEELGRVAGEEAARYIHVGATTQDVIDTARVLQIRQAVGCVRRELIAVARALGEQARRYRDTPMAGRTHLQHAVPITFGLKCATWATPLVSHVERLDQAARRTLVVQLGGAAGTLASLGSNGPAVVERLARQLGLGIPEAPWHVVRDSVAEMAAILSLICGSLSKFALDVALMAQTEVAELSEPYEAGRGGSSTMPQKRNPIASEYILAAARGVHALVPMMMAAMTQDHERSTGAWQSEAIALPQCFVLTAGALAHARTIASGMIVDVERMRRNLDLSNGLIMAESVATALTAKLGRAAAHKAVERACSRAIGEHRSLSEVLREDRETRSLLSDQDIDRLMDPRSYLGASGVFVDRIVARIASLS